jgi:hypothetical protein
MGRRSFISMTTINRIISASNRIKKEKYNNNLINAQGGNEKEKPSKYSLSSVEFNINTRITRIEFLQSQEYRTIQRYITQNYVRYPIYSEWKIRKKTIKKTIKLTNTELEILNMNEDDLIKMFAEDIIIKLNNEELFPSWFVKLYLKKELHSDLKEMENLFISFNDNENKKIIEKQNLIKNYNNKILILNKDLFKTIKRKDKCIVKLNRILNSKHSLFKIIVTFGIYKYLISSKRKNKINFELNQNNNTITKINSDICSDFGKIKECELQINDYKTYLSEYDKKYKLEKDTRIIEYNKKISEVKPLSNIITRDDSFVMLKIFSGLEYEKIIGVYVIHNKENDKYYVGQSKDVMKRIRQHFNGTIPKNYIFTEDYYSSKIDNKDNLFEIKIIKCKTKDELDRLEKELISEYDSWNNGYNGTSGNI